MNGRTLLYRLAATTVASIASLVAAGSAAAAPTWLDPVTFPAKHSGVTPLDVAADGDGNVLALWSTFDGGSLADMPLQAADRPAGGAWGDPQPVGRATGGSARAAFDAAGTAYLVWDAPDGTVQYAIKPRGGGFDVHTLAGTADHPAAHGRVAVSAAGVATFTWQRYNQPGGTSYIQAVVRSPGTGFGPTVDVTSTENTFAPEIGGNRAGDVTIIWRYAPSAGVTGFGSVRVVNGAFANHENWTRFTSDAVFTTPRPVVDDLGRATAAWAQAGVGGNQLRTATRDVSGSFGISDDPLDTAVSILNPDIAIAPDGTVVLAWQRFNQGHPATYGIGASVRSPGGSFSPPQHVAEDGPTTVDGPAVAADATGALLVAWSRGGIIQSASRLPGAAGQFGGASPVSHAGNATIPRLAADGRGDVAAIWRVVDATGSSVQLGTAGRDGAPPVLTQSTIPAGGRPGAALPFAASATDIWSPVSYGWSFGDGATASGATTTHAFAPVGVFDVSLTATDAAGNTATATGTTAISVPSLACPPARRADGRAIGVTANQAAKYTRRPRVQLTLVAPDGATGAILSNDGGFGRPATQPLNSGTYPWTLLSTGPERLPKTIYVRFSGPCIDGSQTFQDDIILDQTPPKVTSARLTAKKGVVRSTLTLAAKDNASGLSKAQVRYRLHRKVRIFAAAFHRKVKLNGAPAKVAVRVRDGAGNFSRWKTVSAHR